MRRLQWYTLVVGTLAAGLGCGSETTDVQPPPPPLAVQPSFVTVSIGNSVKLFASHQGASGASTLQSELVWRSANDSIATITSTGMVSGQHVGQTRISATWQGSEGSAVVRVIDSRLSGKRPACASGQTAGSIAAIPKGTGPCK
jgi:hypothetical protein